jgi:uncharacterized membrane protein
MSYLKAIRMELLIGGSAFILLLIFVFFIYGYPHSLFHFFIHGMPSMSAPDANMDASSVSDTAFLRH